MPCGKPFTVYRHTTNVYDSSPVRAVDFNKRVYTKKTARTRRAAIICSYKYESILIPVQIGLVWTFFRNTEVFRLCIGKFIQFNANFRKVETGNFFIQVLW